MEQLINAFLTRGTRREALEIKIVGGGRVIPGMGDVGRSNVDFVREFLAAEGMPIHVEDVGLEVARRVRYRARTGQMRVLHLPVSQNSRIAARESELASRISRRRPASIGRAVLMEARPIKVLVVDDSALVRKLLRGVLERDGDIEVVGTAQDPFDAREKIKTLNPDVLTLDVEMPKMDGLTFLRNLMRLRPMPVVMVSSLTERGAEATLAALHWARSTSSPSRRSTSRKGSKSWRRCWSTRSRRRRRRDRPRAPRRRRRARARRGAARGITDLGTTDRLIAIGASTGGTEAVAQMLAALPADAPGVVIAQHIPEVFSQRSAERMDRESAIAVAEARDGDPILIGHAYVAPGGRHLRVERSGAKYFCRIGLDEPVNRHRPSVDVLFPLGRRRGRPQRRGPDPDRHGQRRRRWPGRDVTARAAPPSHRIARPAWCGACPARRSSAATPPRCCRSIEIAARALALALGR